MKNPIVITIIVAIILITAAGAYFIFGKSIVLPSGSSNGTGAPSTPTPAKIAVPAGDTIDIGTPKGIVTVKNFYREMADTDEGNVILVRNDNYDMSYDPETGAFAIFIRQEPVGANQTSAERDFLARLGIKEQDACRLVVSVSASRALEAGKLGKTWPLSFCAGGVK